MTFFLVILVLMIPGAFAAQDICDILNLKNCTGVSKQGRRSSSQSLPSTGAAGNLNPANVSQDRGLGAEVIFQPNNPLNANIVTGTGRIGGAFLSTSLENSFFGNRVAELDVDRETREAKDKQYKTKKITLGLSAGLIKNKNYGLDIGLIGKHHPKVKKLRAGGGLSGRAGIFTMGFSYYADDLFLNLENVVNPNTGGLYSTEYNSPTYQERFFVRSFSAGLRIKSLFIDYGLISTKYKFLAEPTSVRLISAAFIYKSFLFNLANRTELSPYWTIKDNMYLIPKKQRNENYGGVQYSINKYFLIGVHYNYFLLRELSFSTTVFF
jgi:hypothetical protein